MTPFSAASPPFRKRWLAVAILLAAGWLPLRASGPASAARPAKTVPAHNAPVSRSVPQTEALLFGGCVLLALGTLLRRRHAIVPCSSPTPHAVNVPSV